MAGLSRPLRPGALAASGDDLWVADRTRPLMARIRSGALAGVVRWDGEQAADRLHADDSGVWLVGGGVWHCDPSLHLRLLDPAPAGASALCHDTLALTPEPRWPTPVGPFAVRLLRSDGSSRTVRLDGEPVTIGVVGTRFVLHVLQRGPTSTTALARRRLSLHLLSPEGEVRDAAWAPTRAALHYSAAVRGDGRLVHDGRTLYAVGPDGSPVGTGLTSVLPRYAATGPSRGLVATADEQGMLVREVRMPDLGVTRTVVVAGRLESSAFGQDGTTWLSGDDVSAWTGDRVVPLGIERLLANERVPVLPPLPPDELTAWMQDQLSAVRAQCRGHIAFRLTAVELVGAWPQAHVLVRYRVPGTGGVRTHRYGLFDVDGRPEPVDEYHVGIDILEEIDTVTDTDSGQAVTGKAAVRRC
jgi:hypothetical protein